MEIVEYWLIFVKEAKPGSVGRPNWIRYTDAQPRRFSAKTGRSTELDSVHRPEDSRHSVRSWDRTTELDSVYRQKISSTSEQRFGKPLRGFLVFRESGKCLSKLERITEGNSVYRRVVGIVR